MPRLFMICLIPVSRSETSYLPTSNSAIVSMLTSACLKGLPLVQLANHLLMISIFSGSVGSLSDFESEIFASAFFMAIELIEASLFMEFSWIIVPPFLKLLAAGLAKLSFLCFCELTLPWVEVPLAELPTDDCFFNALDMSYKFMKAFIRCCSAPCTVSRESRLSELSSSPFVWLIIPSKSVNYFCCSVRLLLRSWSGLLVTVLMSCRDSWLLPLEFKALWWRSFELLFDVKFSVELTDALSFVSRVLRRPVLSVLCYLIVFYRTW